MTHERIFVFGSNLAGRHGKGAALFAKQYFGAVYGQGYGLQGQSFAIPTKDKELRVLPLWVIEDYVRGFLEFAEENSRMGFDLTPIGCGLAGYKQKEIKPLFKHKPENVFFTKEWVE